MNFNLDISDDDLELMKAAQKIDKANIMIDKSFVISEDPIDYIHIERAPDDDFELESNSKKHERAKSKNSNLKTSETYNNIHKNHRKRVREKFVQYGFQTFSEHEVLEMILFYSISRKDTNVIAHKLIERFGTLQAVLDAEYNDLIEVEGISDVSASLIMIYRELYKYVRTKSVKQDSDLSTVYKICDFCCQYFSHHVEESLILITLGENRMLKCVDVISNGCESETAFYPRKIMKAIVKNRATDVVIAHNHPKGLPDPSSNDTLITQKLKKMLSDIGVNIVDHIVCSGERYMSFSERGLLK